MDRTKNSEGCPLQVHRHFVRSRLEQEFLHCAYEILVPKICRPLSRDLRNLDQSRQDQMRDIQFAKGA